MLSNTLIERLQESMRESDLVYNQYHKYSTCFSIQSVDKEFEAAYKIL